VPSGCRMSAGIVDSADVVVQDSGGAAVRGDVGCGGRSLTDRGMTGRDDDVDEQATASASTCRTPRSVSVHRSRLVST